MNTRITFIVIVLLLSSCQVFSQLTANHVVKGGANYIRVNNSEMHADTLIGSHASMSLLDYYSESDDTVSVVRISAGTYIVFEKYARGDNSRFRQEEYVQLEMPNRLRPDVGVLPADHVRPPSRTHEFAWRLSGYDAVIRERYSLPRVEGDKPVKSDVINMYNDPRLQIIMKVPGLQDGFPALNNTY